MPEKVCSVIIPVFNESGNLPELHRNLCAAVDGQKKFKAEFIMIDDGSSDGSFNVLKELNASDKRIKVVKLSRNYGSHIALSAGLANASGDCAALIAADLQEPPELVARMFEKWEEGNHIVWAEREQREDSFSVKLMSGIFYGILRKLAAPHYVITGADSCLVDKKVINAVNSLTEKNRMLFGLISWTGFRQTSIKYIKGKRHSGASKWNLSKKIKLALDSIFSFSDKLVKLPTIFGMVTSFAGAALLVFAAVRRLFYGSGPGNAAILIIALIFIAGLQMLFTGIAGEYFWRIYEETRNRPLYIVEEKLGF